jgi:chromosome segregation ATPase
MEDHSNRLEQAEDRITELEDEMAIKGKTEELLLKQLKTCKRKIQELTDFIKRLNLRIMDIEDREEMQAKGMCNTFNKIITENFPNLEKTMPIQVQEASRKPNNLTKIELPHDILSLKQQARRRERLLKSVREKKQITYKDKPIKNTADFSMETLKARRT